MTPGMIIITILTIVIALQGHAMYKKAVSARAESQHFQTILAVLRTDLAQAELKNKEQQAHIEQTEAVYNEKRTNFFKWLVHPVLKGEGTKNWIEGKDKILMDEFIPGLSVEEKQILINGIYNSNHSYDAIRRQIYRLQKEAGGVE